jgi:hypothetical protein
MQGLFQLKTARDLLAKLRHERELLEREPLNAYAAFNFFFTAEHMLDWLYPGKVNKARRENVRKASVLLQICSHIANGGKHFEVEAKHHQSVSDTVRTNGAWAANVWAVGTWAPGTWPVCHLLVRLKGDAEAVFGESISALDLAAKVLEYWENSTDLAAPEGRT